MAAPLRVRSGVNGFTHLLEGAAATDIGDGLVDIACRSASVYPSATAATAMIMPLWQ